jgi:hypothetical protein
VQPVARDSLALRAGQFRFERFRHRWRLVRMFIREYEYPGVTGLIPSDGILITSWE